MSRMKRSGWRQYGGTGRAGAASGREGRGGVVGKGEEVEETAASVRLIATSLMYIGGIITRCRRFVTTRYLMPN